MRLRDYLKLTNMNEAQLARWVGAPRSTVHKWIHDGVIPRVHHQREIYRRTEGQVSPNDFYDLPKLRSKRAAE
jgi:hypothetical protein